MITKKRGFTLIELLVVIAIIGILSSVVVASLNSARVKARDARRVADVKQIQVALELYYDANNTYPAALTALQGSTSGASLATIPADPSGGSYSYVANDAKTAYHIGGNMEQAVGATTLDDADTDSKTTGSPTGWPTTGGIDGTDQAKKCDGTTDSAGFCYDVSNVKI